MRHWHPKIWGETRFRGPRWEGHYGLFAVYTAVVQSLPLRRAAASLMTGMGIPRLVAGKILNHVEPGVTKVYNRHSYDKEKREALESWGKRLMVLVSDLQVVQKTEA